jgi:hypothetical protein
MNTNKYDGPGPWSVLVLIGVSAIAIIGLYLAIIFKEKMISDRATEFVGTLRIGDHFLTRCADNEGFLIMPMDAGPNEIGILQGSYTSVTNDIDRHVYHPVEGKPTTFRVGCLKAEVIKDPYSNWMLNIYTPPTE